MAVEYLQSGGSSGSSVAAGSGTTNRLIKFDSVDNLADSLLSDDGTNVSLTSGQYLLSTDTGIRRDAAGSLSFTNGSTGHATGLGLGTATPKTFLSVAALDVSLQVTGGANVGYAAVGTDTANYFAIDSNAAADAKAIVFRSTNGVGGLVAYNDSLGTPINLFTAALSAAPVLTVGSASVAGVNYISGTGNHDFSDGVVSVALGAGVTTTQIGAAPIGTVASGTGVTVNATGDFRRVINKVTLTYAAWAAAATTADKTIYTLAAKQRLVGIIADVTATFTGGAVSDADMTVGKTAGGNEYLVSFDVDTATGIYGDADAELGTSINRANAIQGGDLPSWTATTAITARLTTVGANTDALTAGSITFYIVTEMM